MSTQPCREDLAWAAGLFEGEGCFHIRRTHRTLLASIKSTDEDVLRKFHRVLGIGTIIGPYYKERRKPVWCWRAWSFEEVQATIAFLWPWLCSRRLSKAKSILLEHHARQGRQRKSSGHRRAA